MNNNTVNQNQPQTSHFQVNHISPSSNCPAVKTEADHVPQSPKIIRKVSRISLDKLKSIGIAATLKSAIERSKGVKTKEPKMEAPGSQFSTFQSSVASVPKHVYARPVGDPKPIACTYYLPDNKPQPPPTEQKFPKVKILSVETFPKGSDQINLKNLGPITPSTTVHRPPESSTVFSKEFDNFRMAQRQVRVSFPPAPKKSTKPPIIIENLDNNQIFELEHQSPKHIYTYGQIPAPSSYSSYSTPFVTPPRVYAPSVSSTMTPTLPKSPVVPVKTVQFKVVQPDKTRPLVQAIENPRILNSSVMPAVDQTTPIILTRVPKPTFALKSASDEQIALRALAKLKVPIFHSTTDAIPIVRPYQPRAKIVLNTAEDTDFLGYDQGMLLKWKVQSNARCKKLQKCINRFKGKYIRKRKLKASGPGQRPDVQAKEVSSVVTPRMYERKSIESVKAAILPMPPKVSQSLSSEQPLPARQPTPVPQAPEPEVKAEEDERLAPLPAFKSDSRYILYEIREVPETCPKPLEPPPVIENKSHQKLEENSEIPLDLSLPQRSIEAEKPVFPWNWKNDEKSKSLQPIRIQTRVDYLGLGARYTSEDESMANNSVLQNNADSEISNEDGRRCTIRSLKPCSSIEGTSDDEPKITIMAGSSVELEIGQELTRRSRRISSRSSIDTTMAFATVPEKDINPTKIVATPVVVKSAQESEKPSMENEMANKVVVTAPVIRRRIMKIKPNVITKVVGEKKAPVPLPVAQKIEESPPTAAPALLPVISQGRPSEVMIPMGSPTIISSIGAKEMINDPALTRISLEPASLRSRSTTINQRDETPSKDDEVPETVDIPVIEDTAPRQEEIQMKIEEVGNPVVTAPVISRRFMKIKPNVIAKIVGGKNGPVSEPVVSIVEKSVPAPVPPFLPVVKSEGKPSDIIIPMAASTPISSISASDSKDETESASTSFIWKKHRQVKESPVKSNQAIVPAVGSEEISEPVVEIPDTTEPVVPHEELAKKQLTFESITLEEGFLRPEDLEMLPVIYADKPLEEGGDVQNQQELTPHYESFRTTTAEAQEYSLLNVNSTPFQQLLETLKNVSSSQIDSKVSEAASSSQGPSKTESELLGVIQLLLQHVNPLTLNETIIKNNERPVKVEPPPPPPIQTTIFVPAEVSSGGSNTVNCTPMTQDLIFMPVTVPPPKIEIIKNEIVQPPSQPKFEIINHAILPLPKPDSVDFRNPVPDPFEVEEDFDESHFDDPSLESDTELTSNAPLPNFDETFDRLFGKSQPNLPPIKGITPLRPTPVEMKKVEMVEKMEAPKPLLKLKQRHIPVVVKNLKKIGNTSTPKKIIRLNSRASEIVKLALQKTQKQPEASVSKVPTFQPFSDQSLNNTNNESVEQEVQNTQSNIGDKIEESENSKDARARLQDYDEESKIEEVEESSLEQQNCVSEDLPPLESPGATDSNDQEESAENQQSKVISIEKTIPKSPLKISDRHQSIEYVRGKILRSITSEDIKTRQRGKDEESKIEEISEKSSSMEHTDESVSVNPPAECAETNKSIDYVRNKIMESIKCTFSPAVKKPQTVVEDPKILKIVPPKMPEAETVTEDLTESDDDSKIVNSNEENDDLATEGFLEPDDQLLIDTSPEESQNAMFSDEMEMNDVFDKLLATKNEPTPADPSKTLELSTEPENVTSREPSPIRTTSSREQSVENCKPVSLNHEESFRDLQNHIGPSKKARSLRSDVSSRDPFVESDVCANPEKVKISREPSPVRCSMRSRNISSHKHSVEHCSSILLPNDQEPFDRPHSPNWTASSRDHSVEIDVSANLGNVETSRESSTTRCSLRSRTISSREQTVEQCKPTSADQNDRSRELPNDKVPLGRTRSLRSNALTRDHSDDSVVSANPEKVETSREPSPIRCLSRSRTNSSREQTVEHSTSSDHNDSFRELLNDKEPLGRTRSLRSNVSSRDHSAESDVSAIPGKAETSRESSTARCSFSSRELNVEYCKPTSSDYDDNSRELPSDKVPLGRTRSLRSNASSRDQSVESDVIAKHDQVETSRKFSSSRLSLSREKSVEHCKPTSSNHNDRSTELPNQKVVARKARSLRSNASSREHSIERSHSLRSCSKESIVDEIKQPLLVIPRMSEDAIAAACGENVKLTEKEVHSQREKVEQSRVLINVPAANEPNQKRNLRFHPIINDQNKTSGNAKDEHKIEMTSILVMAIDKIKSTNVIPVAETSRNESKRCKPSLRSRSKTIDQGNKIPSKAVNKKIMKHDNELPLVDDEDELNEANMGTLRSHSKTVEQRKEVSSPVDSSEATKISTNRKENLRSRDQCKKVKSPQTVSEPIGKGNQQKTTYTPDIPTQKDTKKTTRSKSKGIDLKTELINSKKDSQVIENTNLEVENVISDNIQVMREPEPIPISDKPDKRDLKEVMWSTDQQKPDMKEANQTEENFAVAVPATLDPVVIEEIQPKKTQESEPETITPPEKMVSKEATMKIDLKKPDLKVANQKEKNISIAVPDALDLTLIETSNTLEPVISTGKDSKKITRSIRQKKQIPNLKHEDRTEEKFDSVEVRTLVDGSIELNQMEAGQCHEPAMLEKEGNATLNIQAIIDARKENRIKTIPAALDPVVIAEQQTKNSEKYIATTQEAASQTILAKSKRSETKALTPPESTNTSICTDSKDSGDFEGFNTSSLSTRKAPEERRQNMMEEIQKILASETQPSESDSDSNQRLKPPTKRRKLQISDDDSQDDQPLKALMITNKMPPAEKQQSVPKITLKASPKCSKSGEQTTINSHFEVVKKSDKRKQAESPSQLKRQRTDKSCKSSAVTYTCNRCQAEISKRDWQKHYIFHNGAAGRIGIDPDIDPNNRPSLVTITTQFLKSNLCNGYLKCEKCSVTKKSAVGLFSHMDICGLTKEQIEDLKVTCEHCQKRMASVSLTLHQRSYCAALRDKAALAELEKNGEKPPVVPEVVEYTETGRVKRGARKAAEKRIKKVIDKQIDETVKELIRPIMTATVTPEMKNTWCTQLECENFACCPNQPKCQFQSKMVTELIDHVLKCPQQPVKLYACTLCTAFQSEKEQTTANHLRNVHKIGANVDFEHSDSDASIGAESEEDEGSSGDEEVSEKSAAEASDEDNRGIALHDLGQAKKKLNKSAAKVGNKSQAAIVPPHVEMQRSVLASIACKMRFNNRRHHEIHQKWEATFRSKNYSIELLFPDLTFEGVNCKILTDEASESYRPVIAESMRFSVQNQRTYSLDNTSMGVSDWSRLKLNESSLSNDNSTIIFCGGAITALDWVPFPPEYMGHQVLAIACKSPDQYMRLNDVESTKCLIQFWKFNNMTNKQTLKTPPALFYSITCDNGPIQEIKFCPSGGFDEATNRMGLLATTTVSGFVNIYAVPFLVDSPSSSSPVISLPPALVLTLSRSENESEQAAMSLAWTKAKHHMSFAAGFSNGLVAVWNLGGSSKILRFERNGVSFLAPVHVIPAHQSAVTVVKFHHMHETRYLMTASLDRKVKVFDLDSGFVPLEISAALSKSRILSADWNQHWGAFEVGMDESLVLERGGVFWKQPHDIGGERFELLCHAESSVHDVACNEWTDHYISVTECGDICGLPPIQKLTNFHGKEVWAHRLVYGYTDVVRLSPPTEAFPFTECYNDENAIVFCDINTGDYSMKAMGIKRMRPRCIVGYPFHRINKVRFNPNRGQFHYYAMGYQAGFVRIRKLPQ